MRGEREMGKEGKMERRETEWRKDTQMKKLDTVPQKVGYPSVTLPLVPSRRVPRSSWLLFFESCGKANTNYRTDSGKSSIILRSKPERRH